MDLRIRFNQQLVSSIFIGEVVTLLWFYEPLRQRRLFTVAWVAMSLVATSFVGLLLQLITGQVRTITTWKQVFTTSLWLGLFFALLEASQIPGMFTSRAVARAFVHGLHKFTLVFAMLVTNVHMPAGELPELDEADAESEASSDVESEEGSATTATSKS